MRKMRTTVSLGLLAVTAISFGQVTPKGGGYLLRVKTVPGMSVSYVMTVQMKVDPKAKKPSKVLAPTLVKVVSKKGDWAKLKYTAGPVTLDGAKIMDVTSAEIEQNPIGETRGGQNQVSMVVMPKNTIRVGQSWKGRAAINGATGASPLEVDAVYTLKSISVVNRRRCAVIGITFNSMGQMNLKGTGTVNLDMSDGWTNSSTTDVNIKSGSMVYTAHSTFTRKGR
jgi:hypothetical protein